MKFENYKVTRITLSGELGEITLNGMTSDDIKLLFINNNNEIVAQFNTTSIPNFKNVFTWCIYPLNNKNDGLFVIERDYRDKTKVSSLVKVKKDLSYEILGEYDEIKKCDRDNCFIVKKDKLSGLISFDKISENETLIECKYPVLIANNDAIFAKKENGKYVLLNDYGEEISKEYKNMSCWFDKSVCEVQDDNGKWGCIDKNGEIAIPCIYENEPHFGNNIAIIKSNKGSEIINDKGEILYETKNKVFNTHLGSILEEITEGNYEFKQFI